MSYENVERIPFFRTAYKNLTKSEKRIADYMATNSNLFMNQTISDVSQVTGTSEITISRFCKKIGCTGIQTLKQMLVPYVSQNMRSEFPEIDQQDDCQRVTAKVFKNILDGLEDTLQLLDYKEVDKAAQRLMQARRVILYGFGNSATVCKDLATRYLRLGLTIQFYEDSHMQVTTASLLSEQDVVIAVSHSGASRELLQSVEVAKKHNAFIIVITSHTQSVLAKLADVCLCGMGREVSYTSEAGASRLIHIAIGDVLYTRMAMLNPQKYKVNMDNMRRVISEKKI